MPKNPATAILRRWRAMDEELSRGLLFIPVFARDWKVSTKTVRRDLDAFRELGQGIRKEYVSEIREYGYTYRQGVKPIFNRD